MSVSRPGIGPDPSRQYVLVPSKEKLPGAFKIVSVHTEDGNLVTNEELRNAVAIRLGGQTGCNLDILRIAPV
jgi:hypothetical protein